jgi:hypothetical protein
MFVSILTSAAFQKFVWAMLCLFWEITSDALLKSLSTIADDLFDLFKKKLKRSDQVHVIKKNDLRSRSFEIRS